MRILTYWKETSKALGVLVGHEVIDLASGISGALGGRLATLDMRGFVEAGPSLWREVESAVAVATRYPGQPVSSVRLAPPLLPSKIAAIGMNYADHVREQNGIMPDRPILFAKFPTSVIGPGDEICWDPMLSDKIDWEAELAVVIGRTARRVPAERAIEYVFGYTVANDVTARDLQDGDRQWVRGKSLDTFCPLGPWIVTRDEIPDPHALAIRCLVNDEMVQDSRTDQLIFRIPVLIEFLSRSFTLLPGDIILTGTPPGVGHHRKPPRYLRDGDIVTVEIDGIGSMSNRCRVEQ